MHEIKARVWTGEMMEYKVMVGFLGAFFVQGMDEHDSACMSEFNTKYPDSAPVMLFTRKKDDKGREIYAGDIVKWTCEIPGTYEYPDEGDFYVGAGPVEYNEKCAMFQINPGAGHTISDDEGSLMEHSHELFTGYGENKFTMEIIGNIYENPELLAVKA